MGCDIHLHVEVKIKGKWEHYNHPYIHRNYHLFCKMAGVRKYEDSPEPISKPRGIPNDITVTTQLDIYRWNGDGHSHSWLTGEEAGNIERWYESLSGKENMHPPVFGYLFGNSILGLYKYPEDWKRLRKLGLEDCRVVFWFDN